MDKIEISKKKLMELQRDSDKLHALEASGVDNWEGYGEALGDFFKEDEITSICDEFRENVRQIIAENSEVGYPSIREAGQSVTLNDYGVECIVSMFKLFAKKLNEVGEE